ncbi:MAG: PAS domain S-box-containing protein [Motiliproteus sp.]|jgi:PAS domain S-box-containing protein
MTEKFVILVVDDNVNNRFTLRALLARLPDCTVVEADSGEAALRCTLERTINLILLDVQMPGMDGFETAQHLQMTERTRHIPVVFVTAVLKASEFVARGYGLGAVDYLTKPIDDSLLLSRVRLYQHLSERELILERSVQRLQLSEKHLLQAKESAEATAKELATQALALKKLTLAVEASPNSTFITDTSGAIEYVNPSFVKSTGYAAREAIGKNPSLLNSGKTPLPIFQQLWSTVLSGKVWRGEIQNRRKDGSFFWVSSSIAPMRAADGRVSHFVCVHADITDKVEMQDHLRTAKEAAEHANRAKSVFLANMSHELRTPLNAIIGFARLLEKHADISGEALSQVGIINSAGQHLLALINDVLDISRIEAGRLDLKKASFDLGELLGEVEGMLRARAESKGLTFVVVRSSELPPYVLGNAHHLKKVLINLLGNAVKYTDQGSIWLRVSVFEGVVRFEVADTGGGISKEEQASVFKAFYQSATGIAKGEGTGLGLLISAEYVGLMGGELSVDSEFGQGSVFTLTLPLPATEVPVTVPVTVPARERLGVVIGLQSQEVSPRILVADDQADNLQLIFQILSRAGLDVRTVDNGEQAIASFLSWQPHFIWMDMRMPVIDGYEATRKIRTLPGGDAVKITALTASVFEEDRAAILAAGCDEMVIKPVQEEQLFEVMATLLGLHYRYADAPVPDSKALPTLTNLSDLTATQRAALRDAAEILDEDAVQALLKPIRDTEPALVGALDELLAGFRFDLIVALCDADK